MKTLRVDIVCAITGYPSFQAAIEAAKKHPKQRKAQQDGAMVAGKTLVGGLCSYERWCLEFTGSLWVDITSREGVVDWRVMRDAPAFDVVVEPYALQWPSGALSVIDPQQLLADRAGAEFWQFWVNEGGFYVYLHSKPILCFHPVRWIDAGVDVLAVAEED